MDFICVWFHLSSIWWYCFISFNFPLIWLKKKKDQKMGWPGLDYSGSGLLRLVLACPESVRMYWAEMSHLQDSLNQVLEIPEFLAAEYMKVKGNSVFSFSQAFCTLNLHLILVLWVVTFQDRDAGENGFFIPFEIVIFLKRMKWSSMITYLTTQGILDSIIHWTNIHWPHTVPVTARHLRTSQCKRQTKSCSHILSFSRPSSIICKQTQKTDLQT